MGKTGLVIFHILMLVVSIFVSIAVFECVLRMQSFSALDRGISVCRVCRDCSYLFVLNPEHKETGPQGLRDRAYSIPKPPGKVRIIVMGDSVVYGVKVQRTKIFTERLERRLNRRYPDRFEVINAGVCGYSPYNEKYFYRDKLRMFQPDIVVLGLCLNDVVDPFLHWNQGYAHLLELPSEAYPNPSYHREVMNKKGKQVSKQAKLLRAEKRRAFYFLYFLGHRKIKSFSQKKRKDALTSEDSLSIKVWLDDTPEWHWFKKMYREIRDLVEASGSAFSVIIFPLKYQLNDPQIPRPQVRITSFLQSEGISALDILPVFQEDRRRFRFIQPALFGDNWHLTSHGHALVAEALERFLFEKFGSIMHSEKTADFVESK